MTPPTEPKLDAESHAFLVDLDGMIESTEEFIADDGLRADDELIHDLSALLRVRKLFIEAFAREAGT